MGSCSGTASAVVSGKRLAVLVMSIALPHAALAADFSNAEYAVYASRLAGSPHDFTQRRQTDGGRGGNRQTMCVFCHTPVSASESAAAPQWQPTPAFALFGASPADDGGSGGDLVQGQSRLCLACHNGMVGEGLAVNVLGNGTTSGTGVPPQESFLAAWPAEPSAEHDEPLDQPCNACHNAAADASIRRSSLTGTLSDTFVGDDHPIGIVYPVDTFSAEFRAVSGRDGEIAFFDINANGSADIDEIRLYRVEGSYRVECASCHDPHGHEPEATLDRPVFLRMPTGATADICITCHIK